jgi:hypothetical protein
MEDLMFGADVRDMNGRITNAANVWHGTEVWQALECERGDSNPHALPGTGS